MRIGSEVLQRSTTAGIDVLDLTRDVEDFVALPHLVKRQEPSFVENGARALPTTPSGLLTRNRR